MSKTTPNKLRELRKSRNESVADIARVLGVSKSSVNQYELGDKTPRDKVKIAYAEHFGESVQYLFFDD